ncbi:GlcNAc transferase [Reticulomyxa filosa]|uniref:GlcNAc transferase n=1 Tax=Reticulomyxa filosa TaxID=46433 RepID=X6NSX9_RETFI|nr:GlcNAc transferase [Reticulomyxa filosa]|eukprot:ETO29121.1 GlcNAc transferase [Reticulomyxa filosa]
MTSQSQSVDTTKASSISVDLKNSTIFVSIINYRDIDGQFTILDLFRKAKNPKRVFVGYCLQYNPKEDSDCVSHFNANNPNVRALFVNYTNARGPIMARHWVQTNLYNNESFYLQIDCHMRFVEHWDDILLRMWHDLQDDMAILTTYPNEFDTEYLSTLSSLQNKFAENKEEKTQQESSQKQNPLPKDWDGSIDMSRLDKRVALLCAKGFDQKDGFLRITGKLLHKNPEKPLRSLFWAAGFSFSRAHVIQNVPYNDDLPCLFFGEESVMAMRLFVNGYNFYCPNECVIYHLWKRSNASIRKKTWRELFEGANEQEMHDLELQSQQAAQKLLADSKQLQKHEMKRSIADFERYCGINFKEKCVLWKDSYWGGIPPQKKEQMFEEFHHKKKLTKSLTLLILL